MSLICGDCHLAEFGTLIEDVPHPSFAHGRCYECKQDKICAECRCFHETIEGSNAISARVQFKAGRHYWHVDGDDHNAFGVPKQRRVEVIADGIEEAIAEARKFFPDMVITDIRQDTFKAVISAGDE